MVRSISSAFSLLLMFACLIGPITSSVSAQSTTCADFDVWIWAQAVFDHDQEANSALDPDGNGIACEDLWVAGFAPVVWADSFPSEVTPVSVISITDGDTIKVELQDGTVNTVHLLSIDAPETSGISGQCGGDESTWFLDWILSYAEDDTVYLETDFTKRDRSGQRLAYVWLEIPGDPNPYMANDAMLMTGWAQSEVSGSNVKYREHLDAPEQFSIEHVTGVHLKCGTFGQSVNNAGPSDAQIRQAWKNQPNQGQLPPYPSSDPLLPRTRGEGDGQSLVDQAPAVSRSTPTGTQSIGERLPSYPDVCILPVWQVGDLDCADIPHRYFTVVPPDPHGFDPGLDGVGCEGG